MKDNLSSFDTGFSATIRGISLFDYLQLLIMTKKDKTIEVRSHNSLGVIQLVGGRVTFSKTSLGKSGNAAFCQIMSWRNGVFKDVNTNKLLSENIVDKGNLLLQAAEYIDKIENQEEEIDVSKCSEYSKHLEDELKSEIEEDLTSVLEYKQENKNIPHEQCEYFSECSLFKNCRSEGIKNMWIRIYCKSNKKIDCERFTLLIKNKPVSETLLPNGNILE